MLECSSLSLAPDERGVWGANPAEESAAVGDSMNIDARVAISGQELEEGIN